jgi:hypothetical protein
MKTTESKKQLLQKQESIFTRFSCLSFEEILYAYSYYLELRVRSGERAHIFPNRNGVYLAVNEFLKKIHQYRSQEKQSDDKPSLQILCGWITEAENVLTNIRTFEKPVDQNVNDDLNNPPLNQENQIPFFSDDGSYKKLVLHYQGAFLRYQIQMYVDSYKKQKGLGIDQELNCLNWADITQIMLKDSIDPNQEFFTLGKINQEVIPYYYIRDSMIGIWESFPENELCEILKPIDGSINDTLKNNFLRILCKILKSELDNLIGVLKMN